jgi:protein-arginine kinase activator protein McsA
MTIDVTSEKSFLKYLEDKTPIYKFVIDNYHSKEISLRIPYIYSKINIKKNPKDLKGLLKYFIDREEYEYADKVKKLISIY